MFAQSHRKWEFNPSDLKITIKPDRSEIIAGEVATFTISIQNKTNETVNLHYPTGQHWDLLCYRDKRPLFKWSQGLTWLESSHYIPLRVGETRSEKLSWKTVNKNGRPLSRGVYMTQGMVMLSPRTLISNNCYLRLLPSKVKKQEVINVRLNQYFDIGVPEFSHSDELAWHIDYVHNDNRIALHNMKKHDKKVIYRFKAKRVGYVEFHMYAYKELSDITKSIERRSYRIEVR